MSFVCQRCKQPLRIDDSLANLEQASADMLIAPLIAEEQHELQQKHQRTITATPTTQPINKRLIGIKPNTMPSPSHSKYKRDSYPASSESFVVLSRSQVAPTNASKSSPPPSITVSNTGHSSQAIAENNASVSLGPSSMSTLTALDNNNWARNNSLSHRLKVANKIFDIMSSKSSADHPMCQECTDMLLESLEKQLDDVGRERDCYINFMKKVKNSVVTDEEQQELKSQVNELKLAQKEASEELTKLEQEESELDAEIEALEKQAQDLDRQEQAFWEKSNEYQIELQNFQNERDAVNLKYDHDVKQYERLQKTVVYNDAFCILHDGPFGTINGYRLGRLSTHPVDWNEINAAWGQTLLLLYTVSNRLKFQFKNFRLVPMGSFSRVEKVDGDSVLSYELYGSGDFGLNRMFLNRRFDHAMVSVLNCLKQLTDYAEEKDKSLRLPYRISKDKIGDLSIRLQFNQDELWTKALRYMLINMKWILVFASRVSVSRESSPN